MVFWKPSRQPLDWLPVVLLLVAALLMMRPVISSPGAALIGWPGDNVQHVYAAGWMAEALRTGQSPFRDPVINAPDGLFLTATDLPYVGYIVVAPLTWLSGPVFGYNAHLYLTHFLSGLCAYLWIRHLTGSRIGGLVAGLAFMLAPFRLAHSYGHPNLVSTYPLPLFFWALDAALRAQPRRKTLIALGGATFLVGAASQYYLVIGLFCGAVYAVLALIARRINPFSGVWVTGLAVVAGAGLAAMPYLLTAQENVYRPYPLEATRAWSASPMNFVVPSHLHPLWGPLIEQLRPETLWVEKTLYLGIATGTLALFAIRDFDRRLIWLGTAFAAAIIALGTDIHTGNVPLQPDRPLWLPAYYLHALPIFNLMRVWSRFGIVTILFIALLAGAGTARLLQATAQNQRTRQFIISALAISVIVIDFMPGRIESFQLAPRTVDRWLAERSFSGAVGFWPIVSDVANYQILYGRLINRKPTFAFMHPEHVPPRFQDFSNRLASFPDADAARLLRELGMRYLILEKSLFDGARAVDWSVAEAWLSGTVDVHVVQEIDGLVVVEVD